VGIRQTTYEFSRARRWTFGRRTASRDAISRDTSTAAAATASAEFQNNLFIYNHIQFSLFKVEVMIAGRSVRRSWLRTEPPTRKTCKDFFWESRCFCQASRV
jgi:hypothetical protein